jgi:hypothetical protein
MVYYSGTFVSYESLLSFLLSLSFFLLGLLSSSQLLSCLFNSPSLATQLGSLLTLLPVGLSIYLQATDYQASLTGNSRAQGTHPLMLVFPHESFFEATREMRVQGGGEDLRWMYVVA